MKRPELDLAEKNGRDVQEFVVAVDALAIIVHPSNPVQQLTFEQLSKIFTGEITNWAELGGHDEKILALSRERNSGTHVYFLEKVVRKGNETGPEQFAPQVLMLPSSHLIVDEVSKSKGTIGYTGLGYVSPQVKAVAVSQSSDAPFVEPAVETAMDKTYPLARTLLFYTGAEPEGDVRSFIDFVLSDKGQQIVKYMEFVPLGSRA
jgi:phosphate transport system substrate-binding protein